MEEKPGKWSKRQRIQPVTIDEILNFRKMVKKWISLQEKL